MKRNRSLEMAVKRMGAELSQWREEGSSREESHRLKLLEQLDARHEHEREKYEARLRAAAEESLRALEKQRATRRVRVCFDDDVDMALVDEAQVQICFGSSQDIIGATETGYLLSYEAVEWGSLTAAFADEWLE
eukprot:jgi/Chrpa1/26104/Chrysochromulina_OHIO_Genome00024292-RA